MALEHTLEAAKGGMGTIHIYGVENSTRVDVHIVSRESAAIVEMLHEAIRYVSPIRSIHDSPDLMDGGVTCAAIEKELGDDAKLAQGVTNGRRVRRALDLPDDATVDEMVARIEEVNTGSEQPRLKAENDTIEALRGVIGQAEGDCRKYRRERDGARARAEKAEQERDTARADRDCAERERDDNVQAREEMINRVSAKLEQAENMRDRWKSTANSADDVIRAVLWELGAGPDTEPVMKAKAVREARDAWREVAKRKGSEQRRPLTADDYERGVPVLRDACPRGFKLSIPAHEAVRAIVGAVLTDPPARPEWADVEDVVQRLWPNGINGATTEGIARMLHKGGVRVTGDES